MILSKQIIEDLKKKSALSFEQFKDLATLASMIEAKTGRSIGVTTLRRLFGFINDEHKTYEYTLNTIAIYLGYSSWNEYIRTISTDSIWDYEDKAVYVKQLEIGSVVNLKYLDREVSFRVKQYDGQNMLEVLSAINSSLKPGDIISIYKVEKGEPLVAKCVIRGEVRGNYKTQGEVAFLEVIPPD